jgi:hypothetical protein
VADTTGGYLKAGTLIQLGASRPDLSGLTIDIPGGSVPT